MTKKKMNIVLQFCSWLWVEQLGDVDYDFVVLIPMNLLPRSKFTASLVGPCLFSFMWSVVKIYSLIVFSKFQCALIVVCWRIAMPISSVLKSMLCRMATH